MDDKELLKMAAKAAGFGAPDTGGTCWTESEYPRRSGLHGALWNYVGHMDTAELWNPLTDDGDALRLAADLRLMVKPGKHKGDGCTVESHLQGIAGCTAFRDDPAEQMRVAIVTVAAEIGKAMP